MKLGQAPAYVYDKRPRGTTTRTGEPMQFETLHGWDLTPGEARELQKSLASRVDVATPLPSWKTVAAADVSYNKYSEWLYAAVVVVEAGTFEVIERAGVVAEAR